MGQAVLSASQIRQMDAHTIQTVGVPGLALMEIAGRAVAAEIAASYAEEARRGALVFAGRGNNGGDGYVIARHLHLSGYPVRVIAAPGEHTPDCSANRLAAEALGIAVVEGGEPGEPGLVIDAVLGTGVRSELQGAALAMVEQISRLKAPVVAVDMPTGVCGDSGRVLGKAVRASCTVTFGHPRLGQLLEPGADYVGRLVVAEIGLTGAPPPPAEIPEGPEIAALLPRRAPTSHKYSSGHLGVVAGSRERAGAAVLTCNAAIRSGCGLVTLLVGADALPRLSALRPEVMVQILDPRAPGALEGFDALAVGPGRGLDGERVEEMRWIWQEFAGPAVFDADALTALAGHFAPSPHPRCLTPHPGEASRLLGWSSGAIQADRLGALQALGAVAPALLKGRHTLVSGSPVSINLTGGPALATAGSGDVLTGLVGALLARGVAPRDALVAGAFVHGLAGEIAGEGLIAGDLIEVLPRAFAALPGRRPVLNRRPLLG